MEWTSGDLFAAYRQAKHALYQEHRGVDRLQYATEERQLPTLISELKRGLRRRPGWFHELPLGTVSLVPKKGKIAPQRSGIASIGENRSARVSELQVRVHLTPSIRFALTEVLWLWTFGPALESILSPVARANRLHIRRNEKEVDRSSRGPFTFWPKVYQAFRDDGFAVARQLLRGGQRCLVATFDVASYYDRVDPGFLVEPTFVQQVRQRAASQGVPFDVREYHIATQTLLDAFKRCRSLQRGITGVRTERGIPIGLLTSRLIANVALASLDDWVVRNPEVHYFARYVDDMLLVALPKAPIPRTPRKIATRYLPILRGRHLVGDILLDIGELHRASSEFVLQRTKFKGFILEGDQGSDFLRTVERDVREIGSERRAFLHPDGLGTSSPIAALLVGSDQDGPIQVLRDADRLKVGRYAASVAISKVGVGVRLLRHPESAAWCRDQLSPLVGVLTDASNWLEFIDYGFRALGVCLQAGDDRTARLIINRYRRHVRRLVRGSKAPILRWNGALIVTKRARGALNRWFDERVRQEICSAFPLEWLEERTAGERFLRKVSRLPIMVDGAPLALSTIREGALALVEADLRSLDRESDIARRVAGKTWPVRTIRNQSWTRLGRALEADALFSNRLRGAASFLRTCRRIQDSVYSTMSGLELLLMTRPPSVFDVAWRWTEADRSVATLMHTVNAIRGTRYAVDRVRKVGARTIDISDRWSFSRERRKMQLVLGNLRPNDRDPVAVLKGGAPLTREGLTSLAKVVNEAIERRRKAGLPTLLVLPELSLPRPWLRQLADRLVEEGVSLVAGLQYRLTADGVLNEAVGVFVSGYHSTAVCRWPKSRPARVEARALFREKLSFNGDSGSQPMVLRTDYAQLSVLICSEVLDVSRRAGLRGQVDLVVVPAWNTDTATFEHVLQTASNDLHCYIAVANVARFSDCRVQVPRRERWQREVCRLILRDEDEVIACVIDIDELRQFQKRSVADPFADEPEKDSDGRERQPPFKPIPPGFEYKR